MPGNSNRTPALPRVLSTVDQLELNYTAVLDLNPQFPDPDTLEVRPLHNLPPEVLVFLYPSRFCQSDLLARFAKREFNQSESGFERVTRFCNWIYEYVEYLPGLTNSTTSAFDTATQRAGVCRDFAHLGIAFSRAVGIPARFVSCYAFGLTPPDFHSHFETFLGNQWVLFDPTRLLEWPSFRFKDNAIRIEPTQFFHPKSQDSIGEIQMDPQIMTVFRQYHVKAKGNFVIPSGKAPRTVSRGDYYRCESHFDALNAWLRSKGVNTQKPLHTLRKEYGSLINKAHGIHAASKALRHADINVTNNFYTDSRVRVTPGLGKLFGPKGKRQRSSASR